MLQAHGLVLPDLRASPRRGAATGGRLQVPQFPSFSALDAHAALYSPGPAAALATAAFSFSPTASGALAIYDLCRIAQGD